MKFDLSHIKFSHYDIKRKIMLPKESSNELAELVGIILGDGNIHSYSKGKKVGTYMVRIAGDFRFEFDYFNNYVSNLIMNLFNMKSKFYQKKNSNSYYLIIHSKTLVKFFYLIGLNSGNKIKNQTTIPKWIWEKESYLKACVRGLIDTDGSIYELLPHWPGLFQLTFENKNITLLKDTRKAFLKLGFQVSRLCGSKKRGSTKFYITRKDQIKKYLKEIGFSNRKHSHRIRDFIAP